MAEKMADKNGRHLVLAFEHRPVNQIAIAISDRLSSHGLKTDHLTLLHFLSLLQTSAVFRCSL
jgi:hypothetical protein